MEKVNYQKKLEKTLEALERTQEVPRLLLHSCCGPCSSYVLEYLSRYFEITVYYFNPNIYPPEEYAFREQEQKRLLSAMPSPHPLHFLPAAYHPEDYFAAVKGMEDLPEKGDRCRVCFTLRLEATAKVAKEQGFDYFTTTLSLSPHKNAELLNEIGGTLAEQYGVSYLFSDFKKKNGFKRSTELSAQYGMYRQDYCGCLFSYRARHVEKPNA
ncbi:epoxyqueuosine reductase QueH [Murdochiella vaginalis]|uniref:epoxyqueuosine reductase QueH n=1 Tax=Murdochiella vaginalis TaxID=1852373 RepID=UPI0008FE507D|nr:epoxyqueuosine reductase QueH [Murdochiella vaginalis]